MTIPIYQSPESRRVFDVRAIEVNQQNLSIGRKKSDNERFYELVKLVSEYIQQIYDERIDTTKDSRDYVQIYHEAMIGIPTAVSILKKDIESYVMNNGYKSYPYPTYYPSLIEAIYEEEYGWGPLSVWKRLSSSTGAQVVGKEIKFKINGEYQEQVFKFRSLEQVKTICARMANIDPKNSINEFNSTELSTHTYEGYRCTIMIPPRTHEVPVITLRKKVYKKLTLEQQSELKTIPYQSIRLIELLSMFTLNGVVAGPPDSGKSTFLLSLMDLMVKDKGKNILFAEETLEWEARKIFNNASNIIHVLGEEHDFETTISKNLLRKDIWRVILGEIRGSEAGLYGRASEQGIKQLLGTIHDNDPVDIPQILTRLYLIYQSRNVNPDIEYIRFARNLHYSITMDEIEGGEKRVTGIQFYELEPQSLNVKIYKIMAYDFEKDTWGFHNDFPERIKRMMVKRSRKAYEEFVDLLTTLTMSHPMSESEQSDTSVYSRMG